MSHPVLHLQQFALLWSFPNPSWDLDGSTGSIRGSKLEKITVFVARILWISSGSSAYSPISYVSNEIFSCRGTKRHTSWQNNNLFKFRQERNTYLCFVQLNEQLVLYTLYTHTYLYVNYHNLPNIDAYQDPCVPSAPIGA